MYIISDRKRNEKVKAGGEQERDPRRRRGQVCRQARLSPKVSLHPARQVGEGREYARDPHVLRGVYTRQTKIIF